LQFFIRRNKDMWEVTTTIHAPVDLIHELGDRVTMDAVRLPTNRIEEVRSEALEQAKKAIDDIVRGRASVALPTTS
jgi:CHASE3 domain sensor protein